MVNNLNSVSVHYHFGSSSFLFQLSNVNYSHSLVSKLNDNQDTFNPSCETAQSGPLFERNR